VVPVVKFTADAKDVAVMLPLVLVFRSTETVLLASLATTRSTFPSPSRSPRATLNGLLPVPKSTLVANELAVILPLVLVLRSTETVLPL
jgi:hypothetical protein